MSVCIKDYIERYGAREEVLLANAKGFDKVALFANNKNERGVGQVHMPALFVFKKPEVENLYRCLKITKTDDESFQGLHSLVSEELDKDGFEKMFIRHNLRHLVPFVSVRELI